MAEPKHVEGWERDQRLAVGEPTGLGEDRYWNEVGNIRLQQKEMKNGAVGSSIG